jgi:hypothetical protein
MMGAVESRGYLIFERQQVLDHQVALFAAGQMVFDYLQFLAGQGSVNKPGQFSNRQVPCGRSERFGLAQQFGSQRQIFLIVIRTTFEPLPAHLATGQVARYRQRLSGREQATAIVFNLRVRKMI